MKSHGLTLLELPLEIIAKIAINLDLNDCYHLRNSHSVWHKNKLLCQIEAEKNKFYVIVGDGHTCIYHLYSKSWFFLGKNDFWSLQKSAQLIDDEIKNVFTKNNTFFIGKKHIYASGLNSWGCLGAGYFGTHNVALIKKENRIKKVLFDSANIIDMEIGYDFTYIIDKDKKVYGFGKNLSGEAGFNRMYKKLHTPTQIPFFQENPSIKIKKIICSKNYSLFLCYNHGKLSLYGCGNNDVGGLGLENNGNIFEPNLVNFFENKDIIQVTCGDYHTLVLCKDGLYCSGSNFHGQLGLGNEKLENCYLPQKINFFDHLEIYSIHCGNDFSIVKTNKGFFGFGNNKDGCLGLAKAKVYFSPSQIFFNHNLTLKKVITGGNFTFFVTNEGIYGGGSKEHKYLQLSENVMVPVKLIIFDEIIKMCNPLSQKLTL